MSYDANHSQTCFCSVEAHFYYGASMRFLNIKCFLALLLSAPIFASSPSTYWSVGLSAGIPAFGGSNPYALNVIGNGLDIEFGQFLNSKFGYSIGVMSIRFDRKKHEFIAPDELLLDEWGDYYISEWPEPTGNIGTQFACVSLGVNYIISSKNNIDLFAKITFGNYQFRCNRMPGEMAVDGKPVYVSFLTQKLEQGEVFGYNVGASMKIKWGLWGQVYYQYTPLDKNQVNVSSIKWLGAGLKYPWGRNSNSTSKLRNAILK